ncbi:MAG TPA: TVP38/TMEM64 family protein [Deltaproteobacteria bacterium]|nr:TVP38/TMEM64 family protein [Deltaproteobacteria bacterium]
MTDVLHSICDCQTLHNKITTYGFFGPVAIIGLMAAAIVVSPIPSAPIAISAGMAYGHFWGTLYIVIGAEIGAITAFYIGRLVGRDMLLRWFGKRLPLGLLGSQWTLTFIVFFGRLLPFISFDILSYAAGLTALRFWRFALATLLGVIPVSFLLAHFGEEFGSSDMTRMTIAVLALGTITLIPVIVKWWYVRRRTQTGIKQKQ